MRRIPRALALILALLAPFSLLADDLAAFKEKLAKLHPDLAEGQVAASPVQGLYELVLGPQVEFVAASDGGAQDPDVDPLAVSLVAGLAWQVPGLGDRLALSARYGLALKPAFAQADLGRDELVLGLDVRL